LGSRISVGPGRGKGTTVSVKRALGVLACAITAGGVGSAVIVGTSASGAPVAAGPPLAPSAAVAGVTADNTTPPAAQPRTTLHLPGPIHVIETVTGSTRIGSKTFVVVALTRSGHAVGDAVNTCTTSGTSYGCKSAFALSGGVILATISGDSNTGRVSGTVTGGSGKYQDATGSLKGTPTSNGKVALTINYSVG
jgi:hypothetical protein